MTDENSGAQAGSLTPAGWPLKVSLIAGALLLAAVTVAPFFLDFSQSASRPALALRLLSTHDLNEHLVVMQQFDKTLRSGVIYPRWLADVNGEYGNAWTNFYPPLCYYLTSAIHAVIKDWVATITLLCVLAMAASGLTFYILARTFYGWIASAIGASLYLLLPYHVVDLYWRGALAELLGFVFLPLLIYFAFRLGTEGKFVDYAGLGLTYGLYVMTHLPVAYLMSYVLIVFAIVWAFREKNKFIVLRIGAGLALGLLVSAIYLLPAILEARYAYESTSAIFPYDGSYLPALPPRDNFGDTLNHSFMLQALALAVSLIVLRAMRAQGEPKLSSVSRVRLWALLGVSTTLMVTSLSFYVARLIPRTDLVAFPWRWLAIAGLFTSLLVTAAVDGFSGSVFVRTRRLAYAAAVLLIACANVWFTAQRVIAGTLGNASGPRTAGLVEANYTPRGSAQPQDLPDSARVEIDTQGATIEISRWDPQYREVHVSVLVPSQMRLKTYNFRGWVARVDGQLTPILSDKDGVQQVQVPAGIHEVQVSFETTGPRAVGTVLSAIGLLMTIGLTFKGGMRGRMVAAASSAPKNAFVDNQAAPGSITTVRTTSHRLKRFAAILLVLLIATAIILMTMRRFNSATTSPSDVKTQPGGSQTASGPPGGDSQVRLYLAGKDSVMVALDESAWNDLMTALSRKDERALESLAGSGRALKVKNETRVRPLETTMGRIKVRILEGPYVMMEGWVGERWLR
jgi:preprotein translocase subunit SecG